MGVAASEAASAVSAEAAGGMRHATLQYQHRLHYAHIAAGSSHGLINDS